MIKPTVGRVVWYYPSAADTMPRVVGEPLAAIVARVHSDTMLNLMVADANGNPQGRTRKAA